MWQPGFGDAVRQSQSTFRLALAAMARPGSIENCNPQLLPPPPLSAPAAALLLTLADFETPVWLDHQLAESPEVADFVRFHTGARLVASPAAAAFAVVADAARLPPLGGFQQGTPEYPDRSTTILMQVATLEARGWRLEGPGIPHAARLRAAPVPSQFLSELARNRSRFPRGVDIFFITNYAIAALPRSVRLLIARPSVRAVAGRQREAEKARGVQPQHLGAAVVAELPHGAFDRFGRMRPGALVMGIVVGPHEVFGEPVALGEIEPGLVLLERGEAVQPVVFAR